MSHSQNACSLLTAAATTQPPLTARLARLWARYRLAASLNLQLQTGRVESLLISKTKMKLLHLIPKNCRSKRIGRWLQEKAHQAWLLMRRITGYFQAAARLI